MNAFLMHSLLQYLRFAKAVKSSFFLVYCLRSIFSPQYSQYFTGVGFGFGPILKERAMFNFLFAECVVKNTFHATDTNAIAEKFVELAIRYSTI